MSVKSDCVLRAVKASSSDLLACLGEDISLPSLSILHALELEDKEKIVIWDLFVENMHDLYSGSSFGWKPTKRKKEIFHKLSRFLLVHDPEKSQMLAFCMFRFEHEEGENVVYCYDIQISSQHHRGGIGRKLMSILDTLGKAFEMEKIVLTVLKANIKAMAFYKACGFQVDSNSPSLYLPGDDPSRDEYDYEILSKKCMSLTLK